MSPCLIIQEACRQIGVTVIIDESDGAGVNAKTKFDAGGYDMIQYNVPLETWPTGVNRLLVQSNGSNNRALFASEEVQAMLSEATASSDPALREKLCMRPYIWDRGRFSVPPLWIQVCRVRWGEEPSPVPHTVPQEKAGHRTVPCPMLLF
ncbi:MAG: hypothetical protein IIU18_00045 [Oscillospiraceae bacterium]|nr:hypothetical protein [Oscillospiraceae bacterium]